MTAAMSVLGFIQFAIAATWLLNISQAVSSTRVLATQIARFDAAHSIHTTHTTHIAMTTTGCVQCGLQSGAAADQRVGRRDVQQLDLLLEQHQ
jgi:hypothetical protein